MSGAGCGDVSGGGEGENPESSGLMGSLGWEEGDGGGGCGEGDASVCEDSASDGLGGCTVPSEVGSAASTGGSVCRSDLELAEALLDECSRESSKPLLEERRIQLSHLSADIPAYSLDAGNAEESDASATASAPAAGVAVAPFFSPLSSGLVTGGCSVTSVGIVTPVRRPVLEYIRDDVMDALADLFSAFKLSRPNAWGDVSERHLEVMKKLVGMVLRGLNTAILDASRLILKPESLMLFQNGEMLEDHCVDRMLEYLVLATGSRMVGVENKCSPASPLVTNSYLAGSHFVVGVAFVKLLRALGKALSGKKMAQQELKAKACDISPAGTACQYQYHQECMSWEVSGESEDAHTILQRILRSIVGPTNVDKALNKSLDPFEKKNILIVATHDLHTKVIRLVRKHAHCAQGGGPGGVAWHVFTHDSWTPCTLRNGTLVCKQE